MTQRAEIFAVLESKGFITNQDFENIRPGLKHVGRNRITDAQAKEYFKSKGYVIKFYGGKDFMAHKWVLEKFEGAAQAAEVVNVLTAFFISIGIV